MGFADLIIDNKANKWPINTNPTPVQENITKLGNYTITAIKDFFSAFQVPTVSKSAIQQGVDAGNTKLVDVRTFQERQAFNIGGIHIPVDEIEDSKDYFCAQFTYVFYCSSGVRSAEAVRTIKSKIPSLKALSLKDGVGEWLNNDAG